MRAHRAQPDVAREARGGCGHTTTRTKSAGRRIVGLMVSGGRGEFDKAGGEIPQGEREAGKDECEGREGRQLNYGRFGEEIC